MKSETDTMPIAPEPSGPARPTWDPDAENALLEKADRTGMLCMLVIALGVLAWLGFGFLLMQVRLPLY